jgi:hypothetical protein
MTELAPGVYESRSHYQQHKRWQTIFKAVLQAYLEARSLPAICAINYDDSQPGNRKLNADAIHFITDIEHAAQKALKDEPELVEHWSRLCEGGEIPASALNRIGSRVGRIADQRGLSPHFYFRHIRKGRSDRRPPATGVAA